MVDENSPAPVPAENASEAKTDSKEEPKITKQYYRQKVWETMDKERVAIFPKPIYGRIPNFREASKAAERLLELEEFKNATALEVNPDKSLECTRIIALENKKDLYVPVPKLKDNLLKKLTVAGECTKYNIKETISRWGIEHTGTPVDINDDIKIDLLVLGSVAVSKEGYRIGKGRGYADLEFAILKDMGAITDDTVIVTTVHDTQVFDTLPVELFGPHDVPVDYILTPTQTIKVEKPLPRPKGMIWDILSKRRIGLMPMLQKLKEKHEKDGPVTLKDEDTDVEERDSRPVRRFKRYSRSRPRSDGPYPRRNNYNRGPRPYSYRRNKSGTLKNGDKEKTNSGSDNAENNSPKGTKPPQRKFRRLPIDFSLMVSNIERTVRIRDLKVALQERGIKPNDITWRGYKGFCYLHYAKPLKKQQKENVEQSPNVDKVVEILQDLKINTDSKGNLSVKVMEKGEKKDKDAKSDSEQKENKENIITKVETAEITAV